MGRFAAQKSTGAASRPGAGAGLAGGPVVGNSVDSFMLFFELSKFLGLDCIPMARGLAATGRFVGISTGAGWGIPAPNWATFCQRAGDHQPPECVSFWPRNGFKLVRERGAIGSQTALQMDSVWGAVVPISEAGSHPPWPRIGNPPAPRMRCSRRRNHVQEVALYIGISLRGGIFFVMGVALELVMGPGGNHESKPKSKTLHTNSRKEWKPESEKNCFHPRMKKY